MRGIRHFTASAIVFDVQQRVLFVKHKLGQWLYPGGHIDPNEDPAQAALRPHHHIDLVYVLRAVSSQLTPQREEVTAARWVPLAGVPALDAPAELPALVADAAHWASGRI